MIVSKSALATVRKIPCPLIKAAVCRNRADADDVAAAACISAPLRSREATGVRRDVSRGSGDGSKSARTGGGDEDDDDDEVEGV